MNRKYTLGRTSEAEQITELQADIRRTQELLAQITPILSEDVELFCKARVSRHCHERSPIGPPNEEEGCWFRSNEVFTSERLGIKDEHIVVCLECENILSDPRKVRKAISFHSLRPHLAKEAQRLSENITSLQKRIAVLQRSEKKRKENEEEESAERFLLTLPEAPHTDARDRGKVVLGETETGKKLRRLLLKRSTNP